MDARTSSTAVTSLDSVRRRDAGRTPLTVALVGSRCWVAEALARALAVGGDRVVRLDPDDDGPGGTPTTGCGADVVVHVAAGPREATLRGQSEPALQTLAALHAARADAARLVVASLPANATHLPADEALAAGFRSAHDVETVVVRVSGCYGPGMPADRSDVVGRMLDQARRGVVVVDAGDDAEHRVCFVDDVVAGLVAAVHDPGPGPFVVGPTEGVSSRDLARAVAAATGSGHRVGERRRLVVAPDTGVEPGPWGGARGRAEDGRAPRGWSPVVTLEQGLARCLAGAVPSTPAGGTGTGALDVAAPTGARATGDVA